MESTFVRISMGRRNADWLRGFSIIMKDRKIEDRVKSKGLYWKDRSQSEVLM
ncbi:hypothetical protein HanPSC8_Chr10g0428661 [Helianthus annuus]|nr:hypothetical protein HanPSC8_Chr10g0428661 [Helianthus annuus]